MRSAIWWPGSSAWSSSPSPSSRRLPSFFLYTNWKMALCLLVIAPFVFWIIYLFRNKVAPMHALLREKLSQMNTCAQENISGNRVVKAFAREDYEIGKNSTKPTGISARQTRLPLWSG